MPFDYEDFLGLEGASNKTGFSSEILAAPKSWFLSLKDTTAAPASPGDTVTIPTAHTFNTGKGFIKLQSTFDTQDLVGEAIGDNADSIGHKIDFMAFLPGLKPVIAEIVNALENDELILLIKDCNLAPGTYIQLGCTCDGVRAKASISGGKKSGGAKGYSVTFTGYCSILFYTSTVTLKP